MTQGQRDGLENARRNAAQWQEVAELWLSRGLGHDAGRAADTAASYRAIVAKMVTLYGEG